jgi:acetyl-CoA synthetase
MIASSWSGSFDELVASFRWEIPDRFNMAAATVSRHADERPALLYIPAAGEPQRYTFRDVERLSDRLGNALRGLGAGPGDRVAIFLPQRPEVALSHLAAWKIGAISVPLTTLFGPDALRQRLGDSGPRVVVCEDTDLDRVRDVVAGLDLDLHWLVVRSNGRAGALPAGCTAFQDAISEASSALVPADTAADHPAFLSFTSGTTGPAKGALHCHRTLLGHLPGFQLPHNLFPRDGDLAWTPADWAWMGGFMDVLFPSWYFGVPVLAVAGRFDPERAWRIVGEHGVRNTFLPPTALRMMRQAHTAELARGVAFRSIGSGGETLGADVLEWARDELGITISEFYGQTEVNLVVGNCPVLFDPVPGSMGRAFPGHRVAVVGDDGTELLRGEEGEIAIASPDPVAFLGYWNRPDATAAKVRDGWIYTGDLGVVDDDGFFWYRSRTDDVISSAGYRIGPSEIEECLCTHPAVRLAAAIGVPDTIRGEVVKAFVELQPGMVATKELEADIATHVRERLAAYLYPRRIEFIDAIPLTTTGKVKRSDLRDRERAASTA